MKKYTCEKCKKPKAIVDARIGHNPLPAHECGKMKKYIVSFIGRHKGAIGVTEKFAVFIDAMTEDEAILKLYDEFDHISFPKCVEV